MCCERGELDIDISAGTRALQRWHMPRAQRSQGRNGRSARGSRGGSTPNLLFTCSAKARIFTESRASQIPRPPEALGASHNARAPRIFLCMPVTAATCERSFSKLKLIKSNLRSSLSQEGLANMSILSIEKEIATRLNYDEIINLFAEVKSRKVLI